jgi:hypothetical protein
MATFTSKECPWTITGEPACKEEFENAPAIVQLGEFCDYKSCKEGSCIRLNAQSPSVCTMILKKDDKGCSKQNYVCDNGFACKNDVCEVSPTNTKTDDTATAKKEDTTTIPATINVSEPDYNKFALYGFIAVMCALLLIMLLLLIPRQSL